MNIKTWTGDFSTNEDVATAFKAFETGVLSWVMNEKLEDVLSCANVPVGDQGISLASLKRHYGEEKVVKSLKRWNFLIEKIQVSPLRGQIMACANPQEGWSIFVKHYAVQSDVERGALETDWSRLRHKEGERVLDYLSRAKTIRIR